jgi:hypothetical protein
MCRWSTAMIASAESSSSWCWRFCVSAGFPDPRPSRPAWSAGLAASCPD